MASTKKAAGSRKIGQVDQVDQVDQVGQVGQVGRSRKIGKSGKSGKSNAPLYVAALLGLTLYAVGTYVVVEVAGGTEVSSTDSNTPNGVVPGPPAAR